MARGAAQWEKLRPALPMRSVAAPTCARAQAVAYAKAAMTCWARRLRCAVFLGLGLGALSLSAQSQKIREYRLHEQEEKNAPFAMLVGPDNTLYTLITRRDGNWVLSRVERWWLDRPDEIGILVEGFSAHDAVASLGQMDLALTPDGKYIVVLLSAPLRTAPDDPYPMEMIVDVVRLDTFQSIDTDHMRSLGIRGNLLATIDRAGHLLVHSSIPPTGSETAPFITWFQVSVPSLKAQLMCSYQPVGADDGKSAEDACGAFAKTEGYASAAELAASLPQAAPPANPAQPPPGVTISPKDHYQFRTVTVDGRPITLFVVNGIDVQAYASQ